MDRQTGQPKEPGRDASNGDDSLFKVRDYDSSLDYTALAVMYEDYRKDIEGATYNKYIYVGEPPYRVNIIDGELGRYVFEEKAKIKIAEQDNRPVGFMIYHHIFDSILIVKGVYLVPDKRRSTHLRTLIFSVGYVSRVFSQTYSKRGPEEIQGTKINRNLIYQNDKFDVWENVVSPRNRSNRNGKRHNK